jgi:hypothetical protein
MVLFGNEFDADERAEVGGGDGLGETELGRVAVDFRVAVLTTREESGEQVIPISLKHRRDFVCNHSEK